MKALTVMFPSDISKMALYCFMPQTLGKGTWASLETRAGPTGLRQERSLPSLCRASQGCSNPAALTWGPRFRTLGSPPGLHPLDTSNTPSHCDSPKDLQMIPNALLEARSPLAENHCFCTRNETHKKIPHRDWQTRDVKPEKMERGWKEAEESLFREVLPEEAAMRRLRRSQATARSGTCDSKTQRTNGASCFQSKGQSGHCSAGDGGGRCRC